MTSVLADVDELVKRHIRGGMHVHCATTPSRPNALIGALARGFAGSRSLTVSMAAVHSSAHALAVAGAVDRMITSFLGDVYPSPRPNPLYSELADDKPYSVELWSLHSMHQRLAAAAQGLRYAVTTSLMDSDLMQGKDQIIELGSDHQVKGGPVLLVPALTPDITLLHGACADHHGNILLHPPTGEGITGALAARLGVVASVERIVPDFSAVATGPGAVVVPGQRVLDVCVAPFGAHPQGLPGSKGDPGYLDDYAFIADLARSCRVPADVQQWYDQWIAAAGGHEGYLGRLGPPRLAALRAPQKPVPPTAPPAGAQDSEQRRLVVVTARSIAALVEQRKYDTILAGIGASHLAVWLARAMLARRGMNVRVCAETGLYGMDPWPGDIYLFSQSHHDRCEALMNLSDVLGGLVTGNARRCLGVLAAAEVDFEGNINTTKAPDGRWLTGSGGANDIASHVDCVVACSARPHRFPARVTHVTSPGRRVRAVACQFGRFERSGPKGQFRLATWLAPPEHHEPHAAVRALTRWTADSSGPSDEPQVTGEEADLLHDLDPAGIYR
jgi:acyl CoA:acetate/3-ketoacid CoA transferase alpha subunit/acyl CoA:acetate/3-ketoacid CoA transferase beta subunit